MAIGQCLINKGHTLNSSLDHAICCDFNVSGDKLPLNVVAKFKTSFWVYLVIFEKVNINWTVYRRTNVIVLYIHIYIFFFFSRFD